MNWIKRAYSTVRGFLKPLTGYPLNEVGSEVYLYIIASYYVIKKITGFQGGAFLKKHLSDDQYQIFFIVASTAAVYACVIKLANFIFDKVGSDAFEKTDHDGHGELTLNLNQEIEAHLRKFTNQFPCDQVRLSDEHGFRKNVGMVMSCMADHIQKSLSPMKEKKKELFLSLYLVEGFKDGNIFDGTLQYYSHYPAERDMLSSDRIDISEPKYKDYECVKCLRDNSLIWVEADPNNIEKSPSNKRKIAKNYAGFQIRINGNLVGFLNVELYGRRFFDDDNVFREYAHSDLQPFKYLIEYQFLKRRFFNVLDNQKQHCSHKIAS